MSNASVLSLDVGLLHDRFERILPVIDRYAGFAHQGCTCPHRRADLAQEMRAVCWLWLVRLALRGIDCSQFPASLAYKAALFVRSHRKLTGQERAVDAMSLLAQRRHHFKVESLPTSTATSHESLYGDPLHQRHLDAWEEWLHDNTLTPPDEQAVFRIDFANWLVTLTGRERQLIREMAMNERTQDLAKMFEVSEGRISQMRREFQDGWERYCGDSVEQSVARA